MSRIDIWSQMSEQIKDLYQEILKFRLKSTEKIVEFSWRYHATYVKVIETILDSSSEYNLVQCEA
jgi:hypothetical protein